LLINNTRAFLMHTTDTGAYGRAYAASGGAKV
jgi:drug/metabolite transporter superfamily protein YnfA